MTQQHDTELTNPARTIHADGASSVVLVCEHATHFMPADYDDLGLPDDLRQSHVAWDPGALALATRLSWRLDAALIAGTVSRLIYDCNRPPTAPDAMPSRSERIDIPGNTDLSDVEKQARTQAYYAPFHATLADRVAATPSPVIVTVHSFTPVYKGQRRTVEIGVLHDSDARLADAMLDIAGRHTQMDVQRNQPYGPADGVTHTLRKHAIAGGHLNVMLEVRNDLIATEAQQRSIGDMIAGWLADAFTSTGQAGVVACTA